MSFTRLKDLSLDNFRGISSMMDCPSLVSPKFGGVCVWGGGGVKKTLSHPSEGTRLKKGNHLGPDSG